MERETGLIFGDNTLKNMLSDYLAMDGTNYIGATLDNYAWTFLYLSLNKTLYGHLVKSDSWIHKILKKYCKNIYFKPQSSKSVKLLTTKYTQVEYAFLGHSTIPKNGSATERLKFVLWQDDVEIYSEDILIDTEYFFNIVNFETWRIEPRGQRHLDIADSFR
ncbi:MAG: hypothetical protein FWG65_13260 [Turicibacter sp.]|nr:hypothetical protein [Turicibacter sp.]